MKPAPNGTRVSVVRSTPRHEVGVITAQDDQRAAVATPHACPYCGTGPCHGPRTANGADLDWWARVHPERGIPYRYLTRVRPWDDLTAVDEH